MNIPKQIINKEVYAARELGGQRGNLIAGVLGALSRQPEPKMDVLVQVSPDMISLARTILCDQGASLNCGRTPKALFIEVRVTSSARAGLAGRHTNLIRLEKNKQASMLEKQRQNPEELLLI